MSVTSALCPERGEFIGYDVYELLHLEQWLQWEHSRRQVPDIREVVDST